MGPDKPPGTSSTSASPSDALYSLQPASTDKPPFKDSRSDERLLDPSASSQGMDMWFRGDCLSNLSYHSSMHGGNEGTANFNIPNVPHINMHYHPLSLGTPSQQFQHGNASQHLGTLAYPYLGQPQTIYPFPAHNSPLDDPQQSTSLPQSHLGPNPQSQELIELDLLYPPFRANASFGPPVEAATTSRRREPVDEPEPQDNNQPPSAVRAIELASPRPADGETTVHVRRDTCITLSFDMGSLSKGSDTYDGLKIPSTPSVRSDCSEDGKKLLHLEIRVLGAATKNEYKTLCHVCKAREGAMDAFPDFRAKGNILVPKKNGKLLASFTLPCYSKHRKPQDSEYCLRVNLNGGANFFNPLIEYELPYSFIVVPKLPPRTRNQREDVATVGDAAPPPNKRPRTRFGHSGRAVNPVPQSTVSSGPGELSSGDSRGPTSSIPSGISENPVLPMDNRHPASPAEALMPSHQSRQTVITASEEETADGRNLVIERINPTRGLTAGGVEIWISGSNFPTRLMPLYVRFGDNFAHAVAHKPDLLSCRLPQASVPGTAPVWLSRSPDPNAPVLGTTLCQFKYFTDLNEMLPVIIRIQENSTPEVAAGLDILHEEMKKPNLRTNEKRPLREEETPHRDIETATIQALALLQNTLDFGELISKTNDYKQTLAHFAVLFGYTNLLKRLVGWNIDLTIADVNGFTALHSAYKKGDRACVDLLLEKGATESVLDALGRAPAHLMPVGFASLNDHDTDTTSDGQPELEQKLDTPSLFQSTDSSHGVSDSGDEKAMDETRLADLMQQRHSSSAARNSPNSFSLSGTLVVDGRSDAPFLPFTIHPPVSRARFPSPGRLHPSEIHPPLTLTVTVLTPKLTDGYFQYRQNVKARISLSGNVPLPFDVIMGHPLPDESRPMGVLRLLCHAECRSCMSRESSTRQSCSFYLDPVQDLNHNQGFAVDHMGDLSTLNSNVTFEIKRRPRRARGEDWLQRCPSESLILTYLLCDDAGNVVAQSRVDEPFQARVYSSRRPPMAPRDSNGSHGLMDDCSTPALPFRPLHSLGVALGRQGPNSSGEVSETIPTAGTSRSAPTSPSRLPFDQHLPFDSL